MAWKERPIGRSIKCNGHQLKFFRTQRGWTQEEFAAASGLTPRSIAKAETGGSLRAGTFEVLADTLSTPAAPVYPEDLIGSPKAIVRQLMENYAKHEVQCAAKSQHLLDEEVKIWAPGNPDILPFAGEHYTIDGFDQFWQKFFGLFSRPDKQHILDAMQLFEDGNRVVCMTTEFGYPGELASAPLHNVPFPLCFVFTFERGKIVRFEDHFDARTTEATLRFMRGEKVE